MTSPLPPQKLNFVHVEDEDVKWLRDQIALLDETIRQTLLYQPATSNAVRTLVKMRDRTQRIVNRLVPTGTYTTFP